MTPPLLNPVVRNDTALQMVLVCFLGTVLGFNLCLFLVRPIGQAPALVPLARLAPLAPAALTGTLFGFLILGSRRLVWLDVFVGSMVYMSLLPILWLFARLSYETFRRSRNLARIVVHGASFVFNEILLRLRREASNFVAVERLVVVRNGMLRGGAVRNGVPNFRGRLNLQGLEIRRLLREAIHDLDRVPLRARTIMIQQIANSMANFAWAWSTVVMMGPWACIAFVFRCSVRMLQVLMGLLPERPTPARAGRAH